MDRTIALLSDFVAATAGYEQPAPHADATRLRLVDTLGCGVAGSTSALADRVRRLPGGATQGPSATLLGSIERTGAEHAAFANGAMVRYEDLNDMSLLRGGGHPSDVIPAVLAAAEISDHPANVLVGIAMAYEVFGALSTVDMQSRGWDSAALVGPSVCVGASHVLGMSREQAGQALAITASMAGPTLQVRRGELSQWKACASPLVARQALFSTLCARADIDGPSDAVEGEYGLWRQVTGEFALDLSSFESDPWIAQTAFKVYPALYHTHTAIEAALELKQQHELAPDEIDRIELVTYQRAYDTGAADPARWQPTTRETADHSLPFVIACALRNGLVSEDSYTPTSLADPGLALLMGKIEISVSAELTSMFPQRTPADMTIHRKAGGSVHTRIDLAPGHPDRSGAEGLVEEKFRRQTAGLIDTDGLWNACLDFDGSSGLDQVMAFLGRPPADVTGPKHQPERLP